MSNSNARYIVNAPSVVSEIIDGEAVIMNLKSGNYYSSDQTGAVVWAWIEEGRSVAEIEALACARYDAPRPEIVRGVTAFLARLLEEELVRADPGAGPPAAKIATALPSATGREPYRPPEINVYKDMQDLLLLDPIHDVAESGWPRAREDKPSPGE